MKKTVCILKVLSILGVISFASVSHCASSSENHEEFPRVIGHSSNGKSITLETERLTASSVVEEDISTIQKLYSNPEVMKKFGNGLPRDPEETASRIRNVWIKRWENGDPRGALTIREKKTSAIIGLIVAGAGEKPGESEIAYLLFPEYQDHRFGTEIISALVKTYIPWIKSQEEFSNLYAGESLNVVVATSSPDNPASFKILDKLGFIAYSCQLKPLVDLREESLNKESSPFGNVAEFGKFNYIDKDGKVRTAEKRSRFGIMKLHFRLDLDERSNCYIQE